MARLHSGSRVRRVFVTGVISFCILVTSVHFLRAQEVPIPPPEVQIETISRSGDHVEVVVVTRSRYSRIILEGKSRLTKGAWVPKAVKHIDTFNENEPTKVTFVIEMTESTEVLRARAEKSTPLPASFYGGHSEFNASKSENLESTFDDTTRFGQPEIAIDAAGGEDKSGDDREIQESDIWAFRGDLLYFFNRLEGLQVIDVSDPADTKIIKRFYLPAAGEEMYILDDDHVGLLVRDYCGYFSETSGNQVVVLNTAPEVPEITGTIHIPGNIVETRLVGDVLYTASSEFRSSQDEEGKTVWTSGTSITSIQLSNPAQPEKVEDVFVPGYTSAVQATDEFFFVATRGTHPHYNSEIHISDISDPEGSIDLKSSIKVNGWVKDKFKINLADRTLSIISEIRGIRGRIQMTELVNYSIENPSKPSRLGSARLGKNESLFATRFDGDRVYVVTFLRVDPLWIVDNSNPRNPEILGELEIPGWSTFIHPMGDKLITMGIDNVGGWKPAVQLFDVSDPSQPSLLSKVPLGEKWAWSEANQTEKAFKVFESAGLILVPISAWHDDGSQTGTQLIDFNDTALNKRGLIEHDFTPRRATMYNDLVYSISNHELVTVDPRDRDNPDVISELDLALESDMVVEYGDLLVSGFTSWNNYNSATLTLVDPSDTSTSISQLYLNPDESDPANGYRISNLFEHNGALFVVSTSESYVDPTEENNQKEQPVRYYTNIRVTTFVLNETGDELTMVSDLYHPCPDLGWHPSFKYHLLSNGDLVLYQEGHNYFYPFFDDFIGRPGFYGYQQQAFMTFDVEGQNIAGFTGRFEPEYGDELSSDSWRTFSDMFWLGDRVIFSSQTSSYVEIEATINPEPTPGRSDVLPPRPIRIWTTEHQLVNLSFSDPENPTQFPSIELPGKLIGTSHEGNVLYTTGHTFDEEGKRIPDSFHLHACAYDETQVSLIDTLPLDSGPIATLSQESGIIMSRYVENGPYELTPARLLENGELILDTGFPHDNYPYSMREIDSLVFVPQGYGRGVIAIDFNTGQEPEVFSEWRFPGCIYPAIDKITGNQSEGFWSPVGVYGITFLAPPTP